MQSYIIGEIAGWLFSEDALIGKFLNTVRGQVQVFQFSDAWVVWGGEHYYIECDVPASTLLMEPENWECFSRSEFLFYYIFLSYSITKST